MDRKELAKAEKPRDLGPEHDVHFYKRERNRLDPGRGDDTLHWGKWGSNACNVILFRLKRLIIS